MKLPVALLNAPVITAMGTYRMELVGPARARQLVAQQGFVSAIGHKATAVVLSELLGIDCPEARVNFAQAAGQKALVFHLNRRLDEGHVLHTREDLERVGYSLALLTRLN